MMLEKTISPFLSVFNVCTLPGKYLHTTDFSITKILCQLKMFLLLFIYPAVRLCSVFPELVNILQQIRSFTVYTHLGPAVICKKDEK